jgi:hypothetical protein
MAGGGLVWVDDLIKESKKIVRRSRKYVKSLPRETQESIGLVAGKLIGDGVNEIYASRKPEEKAIWDLARPMHHGDLGFVLAEEGKKKRDPLMKGVGKGLMLSDIKDREKWTYPRMKSSKKRKGRK